jgi:hypothetical protein
MSIRPLGLWVQQLPGWRTEAERSWSPEVAPHLPGDRRISMRARQGLGAGALTFALFVAGPASAAAAIIPGQGVAGLKLGDSTTRVTAVLGKPVTVEKYKSGQNWLYNANPVDWVTIQVKGASKTVLGIETSDPKQRTSRGIGVGSSMTALRKAYPGLTCRRGWLGVRFTSCWIFTSVTGRIPTNFVVYGSKVETVDVGQIGERNLAPQP